jgi:hypothetical protein
VSKYVGYKWKTQLLNIMPVAVSSVITTVIAFGIGEALQLQVYLDGAMKAFIYISVYMCWSFAFKPEAYLYFKESLVTIITKKRNHKKRYDRDC